MESVTVTIGRNIGSSPMPENDWQAFQDNVESLLSVEVSDWWTNTVYTGYWEGGYEDSHIWYGPLKDDVGVAEVVSLKDTLGALARIYGQEAIGFSLGVPELLS